MINLEEYIPEITQQFPELKIFFDDSLGNYIFIIEKGEFQNISFLYDPNINLTDNGSEINIDFKYIEYDPQKIITNDNLERFQNYLGSIIEYILIIYK